MTPEEVHKILQAEFGDSAIEALLEGSRPCAVVSASRWPEVAKFLRDDSRTRFSLLNSITSLDLPDDGKLACVYDMSSVPADQGSGLIKETWAFAVRVLTDRDSPAIPSVSSVWPAAEWHEREAYDLMGVSFTDHPDLRRILCPDDWVGHPLRKDYEYPLEYQGIPATTEHEMGSPRH